MRILVTGASGRIGRYVVRELLAHGHNVVGIDLVPPPEPLADSILIDLTDAGQVYGALAMAQPDAVVHMGAWANAGRVPHTRTYADNVSGTFNVFQACADLGIRRIVAASSAQVYGMAAAPPLYVPVDEAHPLRPANCYALSKVVGEQAADYFHANDGLPILSFRLMGIRAPAEIPPQIAAIARDPAGDSRLLWTRTDARDAARACRLALEAADPPHGAYNITGGVVLAQPTIELVARYLGAQTEVRAPIPGHVSALSIAKARAAFGYEPRYLWSETRHYEE